MSEIYRDSEYHIGRRLGVPGYGVSSFNNRLENIPTINDYNKRVEEILQFGPVNGKKLEQVNKCYWHIGFQEAVKETIDKKRIKKPDEQGFNLAQAEENNLTSSRMSKMSRRHKY